MAERATQQPTFPLSPSYAVQSLAVEIFAVARTFRFFALSLVVFAAQSQDRRITPVPQGPRRLALVIGNNAYPGQPLKNSVNDAEAVKAALGGMGFDVQMRLNVTMPQMEEAADQFVNGIRPGDVALFYYSGHGIQIGGENYLIPVDFEARTAVDAKYKSYAASRIQENLEAAGVGLQILILDACRDNPYRGVRGTGGGLAAMQAGKGTYIAFATAPGKTADDNVSGANGLFTAAFLRALNEPGLTLDEIFNSVRRTVVSTRPDQVPWSTSSVVGEFYFRPSAPTGGAAVTPASRSRVSGEAEAWDVVRSSSDQDLIEQFLKEYPNGDYAVAARLKLASLRTSETQPKINSKPIDPPANANEKLPPSATPPIENPTELQFPVAHNHAGWGGTCKGILYIGPSGARYACNRGEIRLSREDLLTINQKWLLNNGLASFKTSHGTYRFWVLSPDELRSASQWTLGNGDKEYGKKLFDTLRQLFNLPLQSK